MNVRMRLVGWEVRPIVVVDDGENLTSVPVNPQTISSAGWQAFKDGGDAAALEALRKQIEDVTEPPKPPRPPLKR